MPFPLAVRLAAGCWVALLAGTYVARVAAPNFVPTHLWADARLIATPSVRGVAGACVGFVWSAALVVAWLAAASGQGSAWAAFLRRGRARDAEPLVGMALGLGVAGTASYALGFLGLYRPVALAAAVGAGALAGTGALRRAT